MRIAVCTDSYVPEVNGISTSLRTLLPKLTKNATFCVCAPAYADYADTPQKNITFHRISSISLPTYKAARLVLPFNHSIEEKLAAFNPDIVHSHTPSTVGYAGIRFAQKHSLPLIGTFHTLLSEMIQYASLSKKPITKPSLRKKLVWWWLRYLYNQCTVITTPTDAMKQELLRQGMTPPIVVISNGIDLTRYTPKKEYSLRNVIIHYGRLAYEKNSDVLLHAMTFLVHEHPQLKLEIIGQGPAEASLKKLAFQLHLQNNVSFLGYLPERELHQHARKADLFVTASTIETQGIVVLEAMALGLPIVGVKKHGLIDMIHDNKNGFLVDPFNPRECAGAIGVILANNALRKSMGIQSRSLVHHHSLPVVVKKWENLYTQAKKLEKFKYSGVGKER